jgi:DNA-binding response OmpR family regulator
VKRKTRKVMVVCSNVSDSVKAHLDCASWYVNWADDAKTAIAKVRRERFDLIVLISTGQEMDLTETLFNLRDIRQSMPIAVVQPNVDTEETVPKAAYLRADKNLIALENLDDLANLLQAHELSMIRQSS